MKALRFLAARVLPAALLLLATLPFYRVLVGAEAGHEVMGSVLRADRIWLSGWLISLGTLLAAWVSGRSMPSVTNALHGMAGVLDRPRAGEFQAAVALLAALAAVLVAHFVLKGEPLLVDTHTQLVHARYLAEGRLGAPVDDTLAAWIPPLGLVGPPGWVSQYPPGQLLLFALALRTGTLSFVGPLLHGLAVYALAGLVQHAGRPRTMRAAVLLYAFSPMALLHAGAMLSSTTAAAAALSAAWAAARADGRFRWPLLAGAMAGVVLITRPLSAFTIALPAVFATLALTRRRPAGSEWVGGVLAFASFVLVLLAWNGALYGHPFALGYSAAQGAAHGMGFHRDPWGYAYGPLQALGHTSLDLVLLGRNMLEAGLPMVPLIALIYLGRTRIRPIEQAAWVLAVLPVAALFFFWHHPDVPGPRLLGEALPAWCLLTAFAAARLVRIRPRIGPRLVAFTLATTLWLLPLRFREYHAEADRVRSQVAADLPGNAIVFVHGSWADRAAMRLLATGAGNDVVQSAVRHSSTCRLEVVVTALEQEQLPPPLVVRPVPPRPALLPSGPMAAVQLAAGEPFPEGCRAHLVADAYATVPVTPSLWKFDLPGLRPDRGIVLVRDLGPDANRAALEAWPDRAAWLLFREQDGRTRVRPYEEGMARVWGE